MKNLVVFSATWCSPCQQLKKKLQDVDLGIPVSTVDIDSDTAATAEYNIRGVPTLLLMQDTQVIKRHTGSMTVKQLQEFVA